MKRRELYGWLIVLVGLVTIAVIGSAILTSTPSVTLHLDKSQYSPGELMTLRVDVAGDFGNESYLWLTVDQPNLLNFLAEPIPIASQTYFITLPPNQQPGTWTVTVTWDHHYTQAFFTETATPIPEFNSLAAVTFMVLASSLYLLRRRHHGLLS